MNSTTLPLPLSPAWNGEGPLKSASPSKHVEWQPPIAILGVPFDNVTTQQAISMIEEMVDSRRPHYLATANVDFTVQALHDPELRRVLLDAHLVVCDGMPLVWASKWLGNPLPERVAGSDLVPLLLAVAERRGYRVFFLGGQEEVAQRAVANVQAQHPKLNIAGMYSPPFAPLAKMDHEDICRRIRESGADLLFVSFGCPKQEKWIAMNYKRCGAPVSVGVGATIDFLAGSVKRAPRWMQMTGMEWIFRLAQEPRRLFKRYATDLVVFGAAILRQTWQLRARRPAEADLPAPPTRSIDVFSHEVRLPERLDAIEVRDQEATWQFLLENPRTCILDASDVTFVDSTGVGLLVRLRKAAREHHQSLVIAGAKPVFLRALAIMKLDSLFVLAPSVADAHRLLAESDKRLLPDAELSCAHGARVAWPQEVIAPNVEDVWKATETLISEVEHNGCGALTIDLSSLRSVDSAGVGLMIRAKKHGVTRGVDISFTRPSESLQHLLRILSLDHLVNPATQPS